MSIEKSLYEAPAGIAALESPDVEIMIENPDDVEIGIDGVTIDLMPDTEDGEEFDANLAEFMEENELQLVASDLMELVESDIHARKDWVDSFVKGLEVLGMKYDERTEPWSGACGVYSTILTEAAIRFQSETITETFPSQGPVKTQIVGAIDKLKEEAADRVREDMNYQLTEEMPEYRPEHERLLYSLGLAGSAFKKVYFDPGLMRQTAVFVPSEEMILPYGCSSIIHAERVTHIMRKTKNEVRKLQVSGFYRNVELGEPRSFHTDVENKKAEEQGFTLTDDDRYQFYEVHVDYELPGYEDKDGIALPYVITIDKGTNEILAIRRNWDEDDIARLKRQHFVQYTYIPGFGPYGIGLISLIGGYARAGTSLIRQLVDAGTLSNLPGGLKSRGLRIKGDDTPIAPGEFRDVDIASGTVRDNIMPLPYKEPSQVLLALLNQITDEGRRLGSIADLKISDMSAQAPVGTTLALLERQLKTMSAVQARVHASMKQEFKILKGIIRDFAPAEYAYDPMGGDRKAKQSDYDIVEVIPVSDPNSATMSQRIMQYQAVIQLSQTAPQIYNLPQLHRQMIEVLGIKNGDKLVPLEDDMKPKDPITENMDFFNGKPTKAFIYQDHDAHIAVHTSMMQDPIIMAQIGQNPQAQKMMAEIQAHVAEHMAFAYRQKIEDQLGAALPPYEEDLPPEVEAGLSRLAAQAAKQVLGISQQQAAAQQAQQQMQDPLIQMQQQELQLKQQEIQLKDKKITLDAQAEAERLSIERAKLTGNLELQSLKIGSQIKESQTRQQNEQERAGMKMGLEVAKSRQGNQ